MPALIVDPALQAEVIRQFNLRGELAPFVLTNAVVPIFDIGRLASIDTPQVVTTLAGSQGVRVGMADTNAALQVRYPFFSTGLFADDTQAAPGANTVLADTGAIASAGQFWFQVQASHDDGTAVIFEVQYRNAANNANLGVLPITNTQGIREWLSIDIAANERLRIVNVTAIAGTATSYILFKRADASDAN